MNGKPIWQTTEFWIAMVALLVGAAVAFGAITSEDQKFLLEKLGILIMTIWQLVHWFNQYRERQKDIKMWTPPVTPLVLLIALSIPALSFASEPYYKPACLFGPQRADPAVLQELAAIRKELSDLRVDLARMHGESRPPAVREVPSQPAQPIVIVNPGIPQEYPKGVLPIEYPKRELPKESPIKDLPREAPNRELPKEPGVREIPPDMPLPVPPSDKPKLEVQAYTKANIPVWHPVRK